MHTPEAEWLPVTAVTRVTPVTSCLFYRKNAFNNIIILLNFYIYHNFRKKYTLGNRGNRGNQRVIEMLTLEADWGCRLPGLPPAFFYRKNTFNNIQYY